MASTKNIKKHRALTHLLVLVLLCVSLVFCYSRVHAAGDYLDQPFYTNVIFRYHYNSQDHLDLIANNIFVQQYGTIHDYYIEWNNSLTDNLYFNNIYNKVDWINYIPQKAGAYFVAWGTEERTSSTFTPQLENKDNYVEGQIVDLYPQFALTERTFVVTFAANNELYNGNQAPAGEHIVKYGVRYNLKTDFTPVPTQSSAPGAFGYYSFSSGNLWTGTQSPFAYFFTYGGTLYPVWSTDEYINPPTQENDISALRELFFALVDVPIYYLSSLMSFDLFGINLFKAFSSIIALVVCVLLIKKFT